MNFTSLPKNLYHLCIILGLIGITLSARHFTERQLDDYAETYDQKIKLAESEITITEIKLATANQLVKLNDSFKITTYEEAFKNIENKALLSVSLHQLQKDTLVENSKYKLARLRQQIQDKSYIIILYFSVIIFLIGLKSFANETGEQDYIKKQERFLKRCFLICNSCAKSFSELLEYGNNQDHSVNKAFCKECFQNGNYVNPNLTIQDVYLKFKQTNPKSYLTITTFEKMLRWNTNQYDEKELIHYDPSSLKWIYIFGLLFFTLILAVMYFTI